MKTSCGILKGKGFVASAIALIGLLLVTACASPATPATGEKLVQVGDLACLTGGAATADQLSFMGIQDYVTYFNEAKGIPGVTIELAWRDTGTEVGRFLSGYRVLADRGVPIIYASQSNALEGFKPQLEKDQIPFITGATTGPLVYPPGWVYCAWATQGEVAAAVLDYFMKNWREERPPRLQFFVMDSTWGWAAAEEGTKYAESTGFEVLPLELAGYVVIDATTQLLRIREREADLVYLQQLITGAGPVLRDAARLGLNDKMQFAGSEYALGEPLIEMAPVSIEGFLSPRSLPWFDETEIPGVRTIIDAQLKYRGKVYNDAAYMSGWVYGAIMCEAVERALQEVGYENLNGSAIKTALESMQDFDVDGVAKISFGPEDRRGSRSVAVYQVQGGKIVRVTDWLEVPILVP